MAFYNNAGWLMVILFYFMATGCFYGFNSPYKGIYRRLFFKESMLYTIPQDLHVVEYFALP